MATYTYYECLLHEPGQAIIFVDHGGGAVGSALHVHMDGASLHYSAPRRAWAAVEEAVRDRRAVGTVPAEGGDERVREVAGRLALPRRGGVEEWLGEVRGKLVEENVLSACGGDILPGKLGRGLGPLGRPSGASPRLARPFLRCGLDYRRRRRTKRDQGEETSAAQPGSSSYLPWQLNG
ncbi:hypothetical protein V2G26_020906 [Clonostachys chloroleuca]